MCSGFSTDHRSSKPPKTLAMLHCMLCYVMFSYVLYHSTLDPLLSSSLYFIMYRPNVSRACFCYFTIYAYSVSSSNHFLCALSRLWSMLWSAPGSIIMANRSIPISILQMHVSFKPLWMLPSLYGTFTKFVNISSFIRASIHALQCTWFKVCSLMRNCPAAAAVVSHCLKAYWIQQYLLHIVYLPFGSVPLGCPSDAYF